MFLAGEEEEEILLERNSKDLSATSILDLTSLHVILGLNCWELLTEGGVSQEDDSWEGMFAYNLCWQNVQ